MNITQDNLINQISDREEVDVEVVRKIFESAENIIFDQLSSTLPNEELTIILLNGISIERKYVPSKEYSKGMFQNINCPEHITIKSKVSKYYNKKVNAVMFNKKH